MDSNAHVVHLDLPDTNQHIDDHPLVELRLTRCRWSLRFICLSAALRLFQLTCHVRFLQSLVPAPPVLCFLLTRCFLFAMLPLDCVSRPCASSLQLYLHSELAHC